MFKCPFCGAEFLRKQDFEEHVLKCPMQFKETEKEDKNVNIEVNESVKKEKRKRDK